ncbi:MAG: arylamine N-acetyltransferase [Bacteroidia bacterium]
MIQINPYLQRIEYQGDLTPSLTLLNQLQRAHLLSVPFENLDIHLPEEIRLNVEKIFQKVVHRRRGGFCYELNGLFHFLLVELGFEVKRISASVLGSKGLWGPEYDHLVNLVFWMNNGG